nr:MAG TPA: hypothetical protein [Bacteriophage sp.]
MVCRSCLGSTGAASLFLWLHHSAYTGVCQEVFRKNFLYPVSIALFTHFQTVSNHCGARLSGVLRCGQLFYHQSKSMLCLR